LRTSLTALALAAGIPAAMAAEPQQFPATLAGHALLPAATSTVAPWRERLDPSAEHGVPVIVMHNRETVDPALVRLPA